jgi:diaminopimelate epimerase
MKYSKYHGLGNDYIVINKADIADTLTPEDIETICHRNYGVGSDGILLLEEKRADGFVVRVFNPDGSEAETSGNGMRIVSRYLYDQEMIDDKPFTLLAKGERAIRGRVIDPQAAIEVDMGSATFSSSAIPVVGPEREVLNERIELLGEQLTYAAVNVGNPHCVILESDDLKNDVMRFGPLLETHQRFPQRINVQFARVLDRNNVRLEIWERGAGYTLASGSSSSAVACAAHRLGLTDRDMTMHMPGGKLQIGLNSSFDIKMVGPVTKVAQGVFDDEIFTWRQKR